MTKALIICPTHDHAETLRYSIASVQAQTFRDWHLVVIGDGAPAKTRTIVEEIGEHDDRVFYRDFPKGEGYGELYRDAIIREFNLGLICHLSDDDLWLPTHLERMVKLLECADWVYQAPLVLQPEGGAFWRPSNPGSARARHFVKSTSGVAQGINNVAYRNQAYLTYTEGWAPPQPGSPSDMQMWFRFLSNPKTTVAVDAEPHVLKFASSLSIRKGRSPEERCAELAPWLARLDEKGLITQLRINADILGHVLHLLAALAINDAENYQDALVLAGLQPVPETEKADAALDGQVLKVPMSAAQCRQAELAFLTRRAMKTTSDPHIAAWRNAVRGDARLARRALSAYTTFAPKERADADALFAENFPMVNRIRKIRNLLISKR